MRPLDPRPPALSSLVFLLTLGGCGPAAPEGGAAELPFEGGKLDGSDDAAIAAQDLVDAAAAAETAAEGDDAAARLLRSAEPYEVDLVTPLEQLVEEMGLSFDEANAMIQLPEDVVRKLAAARKAQLDHDRTDTTPPQPMKGGRLAIRFRHLALDSLEDDDFEALLDGLVGRGEAAGVGEEGEPRPEFPAEVRALDGQDVALGGYMIPMEWDDAEVLEFMLVRDLLACCFGGAPQPDEWVQVQMEKGHGAHYYPFLPVVVHGKLSIQGMADAAGYAVGCYHMSAVKVEREK